MIIVKIYLCCYLILLYIISQDDPLTPMYSLPPVRVTQGEQLDLWLYLATDDQTTTSEVVSSLTEYPGDLL